MIAKLLGVGPLSPPQPVNPKTPRTRKMTTQAIYGLSFRASIS